MQHSESDGNSIKSPICQDIQKESAIYRGKREEGRRKKEEGRGKKP
jgi:hypothetical protein